MDTTALSPAGEDASAAFDRSVLKVLLISTEHSIARTRAQISEQRALICRYDYQELSGQGAAARLNVVTRTARHGRKGSSLEVHGIRVDRCSAYPETRRPVLSILG